MGEPMLFETSDDDLLISVYQKQGRTLDDLPYTEAFEAIYMAMYGEDSGGGVAPSRQAVFHRLHNIRKAGRLPTLGRSPSSPPRITKEQEAALTELVVQRVGRVSRRDQLPYTFEFDELVDTFNDRFGLGLSRYAVCRLVMKLAK